MWRTNRRRLSETDVERVFMAALDRLIQKRITIGDSIKINVTTLAAEAGYARTYLYKFPIQSVLERFRSLAQPDGQPRNKTDDDIIRQLRVERDEMRLERDIAVESSRLLMLRIDELEASYRPKT